MHSVLKVPRASRATSVLSALVGVLVFSVALFSQANYGRILGIVTDQTGGVISGATVTVIDTQRGVARTLMTDQAGEYNAPTLIPGTYLVRVEAAGFKKLERQNVVVEVGKDVRVDVTVQPGEQNQTVTVTEAIPLVETTNATLGGSLSNAAINDLPLNGRNYQNLLGLRPGVMLQPGGSPWTQSTNNIRPDETVWLLDGILNVNWFDARPINNMPSPFTDMATVLPVDAIQEFNVEENPKAEFGWKPGAVVNVGVRSGTNTLHGSAYAFGRSDAFDARNFFNPAPVNGVCVPNPGLLAACDKAPTQLKQFGGVVGGPIKKDKLFFFGGYEGIRSFLGNTFPVVVPETASGTPSANCPAGVIGDCANSMVDAIRSLQANGVAVSPVSLAIMGCPSGLLTAASTCTGGLLQNAPSNTTGYLSTFPNDNVSNNYLAKIDYAINDKNRINGMLLTGHYHAVGEDHAAVNANWGDNVTQTTWTVSGNWVYTPSSRVVNEARFGYDRTTFLFDPQDANVKPDGSGLTGGAGYPINTGAAIGGFPVIVVAGFNSQAGQLLGSQGGRPLDSSPNPYWDLQDSVSYLIGKHALKFGVEFAHIEGDADSHDQRGRIFFFGPGGPPAGNAFPGASPLADFFAGTPSFGTLLTGNPKVRLTWTSTAGFVQDDWRVTPKLTINAGLRYSYVSPMHEVNNQIGSFLPAVGLVQQGQAGVGSTLWKPEYHDFSPRLGFAWDVTGKGTTVVRGGASRIYSTFAIADFVANPGAQNVPGGASLATVPTGACQTPPAGGSCPQTFGGNLSVISAKISGGTLGANWNGVVFPQGLTYCNAAANAPCNIAAVDPNLRNPYILNYNLDVQHVFGSNLSLEIGYVGNRGVLLTGQRDLNQAILPAAVAVQPYANQYPYLNAINQFSNFATSTYNSLQATVTKRVSHGLDFTAGYTYGHGLDNGSLTRFGGLPQDSSNPAAEYSSSDYDTRHRFTFEASYAIPGKKGYGQLLEGWKINGILNIATGQPWIVIDSGNNFSNTSENTDRWDFFGNPKDFRSGSESFPFCKGFNAANLSDMSGVTCTEQSGVNGQVTALPSSLGAKCTAVAPDPNTLAQGGCYVKGNSVMAPPVFGTFGTMGRNLFYDPGFKNLDFSVFKDFKFHERFGAEFRVEFFNVLNHPNLANPYGGVVGSNIGDDPSVSHSFGCGCGTPDIINGNPVLGSGGARVMQLGLKLSF